MELPRDKIKKLKIAFNEAIEIDRFGERTEANESYKHVQSISHRYIKQESCVFNDRQCHILIKIIACLNRRIDTTKNPNIKNSISSNDIQGVCDNLENIIFNTSINFPININPMEEDEAISKYLEFFSANDDVLPKKENDERKQNGYLLPPPVFNQPNRNCLSIIIEKIDIKAAESYIDPFLQISVKDKNGTYGSTIQYSQISQEKTENSIIFNCEIFIQQPIESISFDDDAIFLELYHYKPKKGMNSLKCFSLIERDEIKEGLLYLEIYKKPIDLKRKKLRLLDNNQKLMHVYLFITPSGL